MFICLRHESLVLVYFLWQKCSILCCDCLLTCLSVLVSPTGSRVSDRSFHWYTSYSLNILRDDSGRNNFKCQIIQKTYFSSHLECYSAIKIVFAWVSKWNVSSLQYNGIKWHCGAQNQKHIYLKNEIMTWLLGVISFEIFVSFLQITLFDCLVNCASTLKITYKFRNGRVMHSLVQGVYSDLESSN